jgi:hypothetical protein
VFGWSSCISSVLCLLENPICYLLSSVHSWCVVHVTNTGFYGAILVYFGKFCCVQFLSFQKSGMYIILPIDIHFNASHVFYLLRIRTSALVFLKYPDLNEMYLLRRKSFNSCLTHWCVECCCIYAFCVRQLFTPVVYQTLVSFSGPKCECPMLIVWEESHTICHLNYRQRFSLEAQKRFEGLWTDAYFVWDWAVHICRFNAN